MLKTPLPTSIYCYSDDIKSPIDTIFNHVHRDHLDDESKKDSDPKVFFSDGNSIPNIGDIPLARYNHFAYGA